ncbi:hypothetical protein EW026_g1042 [Hermanssonia centrifuga]|uniref:RlpA-like protein double-psi beta-barrel domain-containing protein n=1 Tax=Hermanssonia centrifuga TaxID=98765 RepID=A0A4S4KSY5_9APHY|nr:hypothetical protein EW026_g1042 [Hermanssonia centrifuga]
MLAHFSFLSAVVLSLSLCSDVVLADSHGSQRRHHGANRLERDHTLSKRFDNARLSYYEAGQGACGAVNSDSDFQYAGGSHCFETITITYNGKTTQAQIADECPGCPYGADTYPYANADPDYRLDSDLDVVSSAPNNHKTQHLVSSSSSSILQQLIAIEQFDAAELKCVTHVVCYSIHIATVEFLGCSYEQRCGTCANAYRQLGSFPVGFRPTVGIDRGQ